MAGLATPLFNIVVGLAAIVAGATGKLQLAGFGSEALVVAGVIGVALGVYQVWRRQSQ